MIVPEGGQIGRSQDGGRSGDELSGGRWELGLGPEQGLGLELGQGQRRGFGWWRLVGCFVAHQSQPECWKVKYIIRIRWLG